MRARAFLVMALLLHATPMLAFGAAVRVERPTVTLLRVPDGGIQPQAQVDGQGRIHLIYAKGDPQHTDIEYVFSSDGGKSFSNPLRVNDKPGSAIATGTVRGAQLAVGREGHVHVAWMGASGIEPKGPGGATPMLYTRLNDAGDAFEPQRNLISAHPGLDGGGSIAADPEGNVYVIWGGIGDAKGEASRMIYLARSRDDGKTFDTERAILPAKTGVCACCGMRVSAAGGHVFVAYRAAIENVNRNMKLLRSDDKGNTFREVADDPWRIAACVMSTTTLAQTSDDGVLVAWEAQEQIHTIRALADGNHYSAVPGPAGKRKHPSVAADPKGRYVVAWAEGTGWNKGGAVAWQAFEADGTPINGADGRKDGLPTWSMPAVVCAGEGKFAVIY